MKARLVAGLVVMVASLGVRAQIPVSFSDISPPGGAYGPRVKHVAVHALDGRRLIAATREALHVSTDGGSSWRETASLPGDAEALFAHKGRPGLVFMRGTIARLVGMSLQRLFPYTLVSKDFGETWSTIADGELGEGALVMSPFASDPISPEHLLATKVVPGFSFYMGFSAPAEIALAESRDGGTTWSESLPAFPFMAGRGMRAIQGPTPATPDRIFVTTHDGGSYVSATGGRSWSEFPTRPIGRFFWFRQDPANGAVIYASAELADGSGRGIVRSTDSGNSWQLVYPIALDPLAAFGATNFGEITVDPVRPSRLWLSMVKAGVLLSEDRGTTWQAVGFVPDPLQCDCYGLDPDGLATVVVPSPADSAQVYVISNGRLYKGTLPARRRVAVEYQYGNRFWITGDPAEALSQDHRANEAVRTGARFGLWSPLDAPAGSRGVCRFQGSPVHGQSSRFIALQGSECEIVKAGSAFVLEGENEYLAVAPDESGNCTPGLVPVHRFNNLEPNVNHRYVADAKIADDMRARGWYDEGVRMCARPLGSDE